jgi:hypothetical protein
VLDQLAGRSTNVYLRDLFPGTRAIRHARIKCKKSPFSSKVKQSALRRTATINPKFPLKYDE